MNCAVLIAAAFAFVAATIAHADESDRRICTLDRQQQQQSIDAYAKIHPVFIDRRCSNCHGAVNPYVAQGAHLGDVIPKGEAQQCAGCHNPAKAPWQLANSEFVGKSPADLCEFFQRTMATEEFLQHASDDALGFIAVAFGGTRGLNGAGEAEYEEATGRVFRPEPVKASTFGVFETNAHAWIAALGSFQKPPSCGCRPLRYQLVMKHAVNWDERIVKTHHVAKEGEAEVVFDLVVSNGLFAAEATVPRTAVQNVGAPGATCKSTAEWTETWDVDGEFVEDGATARITLITERATPLSGFITCVTPERTMTQRLPPGSTGSGSGTMKFEMPARIDEPKSIEFQLPGPSGKSKSAAVFVFREAATGGP